MKYHPQATNNSVTLLNNNHLILNLVIEHGNLNPHDASSIRQCCRAFSRIVIKDDVRRIPFTKVNFCRLTGSTQIEINAKTTVKEGVQNYLIKTHQKPTTKLKILFNNPIPKNEQADNASMGKKYVHLKQEIEDAPLYKVAPYSASTKQSQFGDSPLYRERTITVLTLNPEKYGSTSGHIYLAEESLCQDYHDANPSI